MSSDAFCKFCGKNFRDRETVNFLSAKTFSTEEKCGKK